MEGRIKPLISKPILLTMVTFWYVKTDGGYKIVDYSLNG